MSQLITFEKIVPEGKAMGHLADGRAVFTIGPLPGEKARVSISKQRRSYAEALLREIIDPSPERSDPAEDHCLVCSPWQGVAYDYQLDIKRRMLEEALAQHHIAIQPDKLVPSSLQLAYRNRLDFTVARLEGRLQLAFHVRGSWNDFVGLPHGCQLGTPAMNQAALNLIQQLDRRGINVEPATITVRQSHSTKNLLTILTTSLSCDWEHIDTSALGSFLVSRPLAGSGAPGEIVYQAGDKYLSDKLAEIDVSYPYNAFFQTNIPVFEEALAAMIKAAPSEGKIVELYSGVGSIGLPLAAKGAAVHGVETTHEAVEFAERSARANNIASYTADCIAAERMDSTILHEADCVIVDPPRAGLHPKVIQWLIESKPKQLLYLSCNPVTQARDLAKLQAVYRCNSLTGFDFYPGTLHLEALAILSYA